MAHRGWNGNTDSSSRPITLTNSVDGSSTTTGQTVSSSLQTAVVVDPPVTPMDEESRKRAVLLLWSLNAWNKKESSHNELVRGAGGAASKRSRRQRAASQRGGALDDKKSFLVLSSNGRAASDRVGSGGGRSGGTSRRDDQDQPSISASCSAVCLQIREANTEADHCCDFIEKTCEIIGNTCLVTMLLSISILLPFGMFTIGVKNLEDCPVQPKIPVYLLVGGCFGLLKQLSLLWQHIRSRRFETSDDVPSDFEDDTGTVGGATGGGASSSVMTARSWRISEFAITAFLMTWFALGNYWVLSIWRPPHAQPLDEPSNWCDRTVYMFAFTQIIICHAFLGAGILLLIVLALCYRHEPIS